MKRSEVFYVISILFAIQRIEKYLKNIQKKEFLRNELIQDGVYRQLEIIGEASSKLSKATQRSIGDLPWVDIIGLRNKLVHEYFGIDCETVWVITKEDLPVLKNLIKNYLDKNKDSKKILKF